MKISLKNRKKQVNRGITLIALVITIIVLLILAGVSIATLTGEGGILTKAKTASEQTEEVRIEEEIKMAIMGSWKQDGKFDVELLKKEIERIEGKVITEDENTITVEKENYQAVIDKTTGKILEFENVKGIIPKIEVDLYQENGSSLLEGETYETIILTIKIINKAQLGKIDEIQVKDASGTEQTKKDMVMGEGGEASYQVPGTGTYTITVKATTDGVQRTATIQQEIREIPEAWKITTKTDIEWYNYGNYAKIAEPKLTGKMKPIKYTGEEQSGNKWANAITADGSMWVWIPRYAYKITEGYHSNTAGTIEIAFLDLDNHFLNGETGTLVTDPSAVTYTNNVQDQWLVHPAFTSNAANGGGFGDPEKGVEGLWIGKFEATGTATNLSVKPGVTSLREMTINAQYKLAKISTFGEIATINSHMAKNSEWGATAYLGHSQYGTNKAKVEQNTSSNLYTGGSNSKATIYTTNKNQSTTHNATGVYDMNGGSWEFVASYVNNGSSNLTNGGITQGDLWGASDTERATSTAYKMVYEGVGTSATNYNTAQKYKGDGMYETSNTYSSDTGSWFVACTYFPDSTNSFFYRSGYYSRSDIGTFCFMNSSGGSSAGASFRPVLAF